jgi:hypothetical protein
MRPFIVPLTDRCSLRQNRLVPGLRGLGATGSTSLSTQIATFQWKGKATKQVTRLRFRTVPHANTIYPHLQGRPSVSDPEDCAQGE